MRTTSLKPLALTFAACMTLPAVAVPVASDGFESYATGTLSGNAGTGWNGAWSIDQSFGTVNVVSGGLSYAAGDVVVDGGSQSLELTLTEDGGITNGLLSRTLASSQTGTVYMSFLFSDVINTDLTNDFVQLGFESSIPIPDDNPDASVMRRNGTFQARSTSTTSNSADSTIATGVGTTHLLVMKAVKNGSTYTPIELFVDPTSATEPIAAGATANANSNMQSLDTFVARSAFHDAGDVFRIDAITIGTTYEDVVPIPEPSSLALLGLGGLLIYRRRR